ncbi:hypothetical protein D3C81_1187180 [compost metagenome]
MELGEQIRIVVDHREALRNDKVGQPHAADGDAHALRSHAIWENFRHQNPGTHSPGQGVKHHKEQHAEQGKVAGGLGVERIRGDKQPGNGAKGAVTHQRNAAHAIHQHGANHRADQLQHADPNGLEQCLLGIFGNGFQHHWRVVHHYVDAGDLLQHGDHTADKQNEAHPHVAEVQLLLVFLPVLLQ